MKPSVGLFFVLGQTFDLLAVDIYYHKSCYIKYTIDPIATSDKNHINPLNATVAPI